MVRQRDRLLTNARRSIRRAFPRFLSLMVMSFLGVFVFAGLQATAPDMMAALDDYMDRGNTYDIRIVSAMGLTDEDLDAVRDLEGIAAAEGCFSVDVLTQLQEEYVIHAASLTEDVNQTTLLSGRMPEAADEIVVEENLLTRNGMSLGDRITLEDDSLACSEYTIVGTVDSTLYFNYTGTSQSRGSTSVGTGTIHYYAFLLPEAFAQEYYSTIYCTVSGAAELAAGDEDYLAAVDAVYDRIDAISADRAEQRLTVYRSEAEEEIDEQEAEAEKELSAAKMELDAAKLELENAETELTALKAASDFLMLEDLYSDSLEDLQESYDEGLAAYEDGEAEYEQQEAEVREKIADARETLAALKEPRWYLYTREDDETYGEYIDDTGSIRNLSLVFPVIFFAVAVLVSLISMNRMVEDERGEIGTMKSLGFSNRHIAVKYLLFSALAVLLGGIFGAAGGLVIIPNLINNIYKILFDLPTFPLGLNLKMTLLGFAIAVVCICGTTVYTVTNVLREKPAELMRPKAPKRGKRVFLEHLPGLWQRIRFSDKVTIRNLFRYKKRVTVTVLGVAGCTALMLCGFGIRDSIVDIPSMQYGSVFTFDGTSYVSGASDEELSEIFALPEITDTVEVESLSAESGGCDVTMMIAESGEALGHVMNLKDTGSGETLELASGGVIVTEKMADLLDLSVGDTLELTDVDHNAYEFPITGIIDNYVMHYCILDAETFESAGMEFTPNIVYFRTEDLTDEEQESLQSELLKSDAVLNVSFASSLVERVSNMLKSLNKVVLILIVLASLLSFVVLYNLSSININERKREIATLKVLGFFDGEVDSYITRENILLTILGIAIGLVLGYFLTHIVVATVEIEKARFLRVIKPASFVWSGLMSMAFTLIVNTVMHFHLKHIDMIESLKSVE